MHQVERGVDLFQTHDMRDHRVDLDLALHVHVDDLGHVGAAFGAAERGAAPVAPGHQLERPRRDLLARFGHADDDRGAPAAMAGLERGAHDVGIARRVEGIVRAAIGHLDDFRDDILAAHALGVEERGHAELAAPFLAIGIDIDTDDPVRTRQPRTLNDVEADAAQAEHHDIVADLDLGGVDHRADPGGDTAADIAAGLERRVLANFGDRDLGQHGEVREGRAAHVMVDRLALVAEPGGTVGHQPLALGRADRGAQVGLARKAAFALAAFRGVQGDDMIARLDRRHARADLAHDPGAFMAEHAGEDSLAVESVERIGIGMADARRHDLDQNLARLGTFQVELDDFQRLLRFKGNGGTGLHGSQTFC